MRLTKKEWFAKRAVIKADRKWREKIKREEAKKLSVKGQKNDYC